VRLLLDVGDGNVSDEDLGRHVKDGDVGEEVGICVLLSITAH
jgi:hypothetical protein